MCEANDLRHAPHFTSLQKAEQQLLSNAAAAKLLQESIFLVLKIRATVSLAAIDSTGFESRHVSQYPLQRKEGNKPIFPRFHPKLVLICECKSPAILSFHPTHGPIPDNPFLKPGRDRCAIISIDKLLGDAGYDGEHNHRYARNTNGVRAFIPAIIGRPSKNPLKGRCRRLMAKLFENKKRISYGQRWQVETVFSMIKRRFSTATRARKRWQRIREMTLMVLSFNLALRLLGEEFYRAGISLLINTK